MSQAADQSSKRNKRHDPAVEAKLRVATARSVLRSRTHKHISPPASLTKDVGLVSPRARYVLARMRWSAPRTPETPSQLRSKWNSIAQATGQDEAIKKLQAANDNL